MNANEATVARTPDGPDGALAWRSAWAAGAVALVLVLLLALGHLAIAFGLIAAGLLFVTAVLRPVWLLWGSVFTLVAVPTYARMKVLPGVPPLTISLVLLAMLCAVLVLASLLGARGVPPLADDGRRVVRALFLLGLTLLVSAVTQPGPESVDFWIKVVVVPGMVCFAMLRLVRTTSDLRALFLALIGGSIAAALYAVGEFASGRNPVLQFFEGQGEDSDWYWEGADFARMGAIHRTYSVFTNPIEFGALMSMVLPYAILRFMDARHARARVAWCAVALLLLLGLTLSFSRGPMVATLVTALGLGVVFRAVRRFLVYAAVAGALAAAAAWPWYGEKVADRIGDKSNVTLRLKLWEIGAHVAADHPLFGVGLANFPEHQLETVRKHRIDTLGEPNSVRIKTTENVFVQFAAEAGAVGYVALALVAVATVRLVLGLRRRLPQGDPTSLLFASVAVLVAYAVNGLSVVVYQEYVTTIVAGLGLGALLVLDRIHPRAAGALPR